jgi:hypothetical protein
MTLSKTKIYTKQHNIKKYSKVKANELKSQKCFRLIIPGVLIKSKELKNTVQLIFLQKLYSFSTQTGIID